MKGIQGTSNKTYMQLMGNGLRYEIPKFQRDYTWDTEQWDDLWLVPFCVFAEVILF